MPISESCAAELSHVGLLAGVSARSGPGKLSPILPRAPSLRSSPGFGGMDRVFRANGVEGLLRTLPFTKQALAGLEEISLLISLLATIRRTLGVDVLAPKAGAKLQEKLQKVCGNGVRLPQPQMPKLDPSVLLSLVQIGSAAVALRAAGLDLFGTHGVRDLQAWLSSPSTSQLRAALGNMPPRMATVNGLARLANVSLVVRSVQKGLNVNMLHGPSALKIPALLAPLKTGQLASLWPAITSGALCAQIGLPDPGHVANLNAHTAGLQVVQSATGLNPLDQRDAAKLFCLLKTLESNGLCRAVQTAPIRGAQLEGLNRLTSSRSSLEATRTGLGIDLLEKDAGPKLARAINGLHEQAQPSLSKSSDWAEVLAALARLAQVGTAANPVAL